MCRGCCYMWIQEFDNPVNAVFEHEQEMDDHSSAAQMIKANESEMTEDELVDLT